MSRADLQKAGTAPEERTEIPVALEKAFARGDHLRARRLAERLASSEAPDLRALGEDYLARLRPDPALLRLLAGSFLFLVLLTVYVYAVGR